MTHNVARYLADFSHLLSILILIAKMLKTRSVAGISFQSQALYLLVFLTRYTDLIVFQHTLSFYNTVMKLTFISTSAFVLYLMRFRFKATWDPTVETFRVEWLVVPAAVLALWMHYSYGNVVLEILWSFSVFLESVAMLPQLFQMQRTGRAETITAHYLFALGIYRALYVVAWVLRYYQRGAIEWITMISGVVQTVIYMDFFYVYLTKVAKGQLFELDSSSKFGGQTT